MTLKDIMIIEKIMNSERMGYAFFSSSDGKVVKESLVSTTPDNIASLMSCFCRNGVSMKIKDMTERVLIETEGAQIKNCTSSKLRSTIEDILSLAGSSGGKASEMLVVAKDVAEQYFFEEDQAVSMMEIGVLQG